VVWLHVTPSTYHVTSICSAAVDAVAAFLPPAALREFALASREISDHIRASKGASRSLDLQRSLVEELPIPSAYWFALSCLDGSGRPMKTTQRMGQMVVMLSEKDASIAKLPSSITWPLFVDLLVSDPTLGRPVIPTAAMCLEWVDCHNAAVGAMVRTWMDEDLYEDCDCFMQHCEVEDINAAQLIHVVAQRALP
jgi:hypothetical protein